MLDNTTDFKKEEISCTENGHREIRSVLSSPHGEEKQKFVKSCDERAYVRRLNALVLPLVGLIIFIQFCDKASITVGPVLGLNAELELTGTQFSWLGAIFYLGYLVFQVPNQFILQRVPHAKYLSVLLVLWGLVMVCSGLVNNFSQLMACRFLLGLFEAASTPTLYLITSVLYRRSEQSLIFGFITMSSGIGAMFGVLTAYGFSFIDNAHGITNWRWGNYIYGAFTILLGFISYFSLVDRPEHPLVRLKPSEEDIIENRKRDSALVKHGIYKYDQIWEALTEIRFWLVAIAVFCINMHNGGMLVFSTTFVVGLGFNGRTALLLQLPSALASALGVFIAIFLARKTKQMVYSGIVMLIISIVGLIILLTIPSGEIKLLGYYLSWAATGSYALVVTLVGSNVKGYTKKIFYNGMLLVTYTLGSFTGPLMMTSENAPRYLPGIGGFLSGFVVALLCYIGIRIQMTRANCRRGANQEAPDMNLDLTDKQDEGFVYHL